MLGSENVITLLGFLAMQNASVLIISDNGTLRQTIAEFISLLEEIKFVEITDSVHPQLNLANKISPPQFVLLDADNGGLTLVKYLRASLPYTKIIVLTSYDLDIYCQAAKQSGADDCVLKVDLAAKLHPLLRSYLQQPLRHHS